MKKKTVIISLLILLLGLSVLGVLPYLNKPNRSTVQETVANESIYFNNPEAIFLRQTFNDFLKTPNNGISNGLNEYGNSYYDGPFIVYEENNSLAGGKQLEIIFVNKPDKMFTALVYKLATGEYELKGFGQNERVTSENLEKIKTQYKQYLGDSKYFY